jgi:hypothetical protein
MPESQDGDHRQLLAFTSSANFLFAFRFSLPLLRSPLSQNCLERDRERERKKERSAPESPLLTFAAAAAELPHFFRQTESRLETGKAKQGKATPPPSPTPNSPRPLPYKPAIVWNPPASSRVFPVLCCLLRGSVRSLFF